MFSLCQQTNKTIPSKIEKSSDWMQFSVFATVGRHTKFSSGTLVFFFQNEGIFIQLDELDRINHVSIGFKYSLTQTQKTF